MSNWPRSPILLEASEFVSGEDPLLFWEFLERIQAMHLSATQKEVYESVLEHAEQLLSPLVFNCLPLALSLHSHSPSVAMYQQLAEEKWKSLSRGGESCVPWVELGRRVSCSITTLLSLIDEEPISQPELYPFDHVYPASPEPANTSSLPVAILYCQLGTVACHQWHTEMATLATQGTIRYVFRHYFETAEEAGSYLSGYGVQLAVKNSEYKAVDDTQVEDDSDIDEEEAELEVDTHGFSFPTLKSLHADLASQLEDFRLHIEHSSREIPELKAWQLQDLGFQAVQRVAASPPDMALSVIRDLTQSLPTSARSLSRVAVKKDLRSEVAENQRTLQQYGMEPGDSVILFNGIALQSDNADAFSVLEVLLSESRLLSGLTDLGLSVSDAHSLVKTPVHSQTQSFAVDMRSDSVVFINDLESDRQYSGWPKSLKQFLQPMFPGSLRQVARNAFNLVFCFDPASLEGEELAEYITLFLENLVPVRLGVVLVSAADTGEEVGMVLTRGFYYIAENYSGRQALKWLLKVQSSMSVEAARVAMETEFPDAPLDVLEESSTHTMEAAAFFKGTGLRLLPQVLLNGVLLDLEEDLEAAIVGQLQQQTFLLQRWIYMVRDYFEAVTLL
jgi:UDP-glucose:glycoprotein glucosyltransferase